MGSMEEFRAEVRAWLGENCPIEMRQPAAADSDYFRGGKQAPLGTPAQRLWLERMSAKGWTVPTWPVAYGGAGLSPVEAKILREEMAAISARPPLSGVGVGMVGPAILRYGTEEQKLQHLLPLSRGETGWCQGYSEPNAGSDLASLAMSAERQGDDYVVNGQKIWTSHAVLADWCFCLVRTSKETKHRGISVLLIDLASPGVTIRPIKLISGKSSFCESFYDNVVVPSENLLYNENEGWEVATFLLKDERDLVSVTALKLGDGDALINIALKSCGVDGAGRLDNPSLRARIALHEVRRLAFIAMQERAADEGKDRSHPARSSMMKLFGSELNKVRHELIVSAGGLELLDWEGPRTDDGLRVRTWLRTKGNTIEGGTSEVQLNIIAKRILELPSS